MEGISEGSKMIQEDTVPNAGLELLLRNLRKVLIRHGYSGADLETKIKELQQKDFPRLTKALFGDKF
jgi:hypothetical protein